MMPLAWTHRTSEVAEAGLIARRRASADERAAIAKALDLIACDDLVADYTVRPLGAGRYRMQGTIAARVTQACVVSLEPVPARIEETFEVEFWPGDSIPPATDAEIEVLGASDIEPLEHSSIEAGRIVFETLSASLDPYPRKEGALLEWPGGEEPSDPGGAGPFASLKSLKKRP